MNATWQAQPVSINAAPLNANFGGLLDSMPDAIVLVNDEGRIALVNKRAEDLFGYTAPDLLGKPLEMLMPERFRTAHFGHQRNYLHHPQKRNMGSGLDLFGLRKDGSEFPADISLGPVKVEGALMVMTAIRDITERKQIQKELQAKNAALEAANQELQAFSYSVSHDLRAPLRAMAGFATVLKEALGPHPPPDSEHALCRIEENVVKMSQLVDGLLDFSRLSWKELTKELIDPRELAQSVYNDLKATRGEQRLEFELGKLPGCKADPVLLRQVFANLLSNALKYTRDRNPAVIKVGCCKENGEDVYFVRDNGAGFAMEHAGKLFRIFQRLHSPREFEGTGVGLAIVQRIVQRHGGRVWGKGEVNRGATFYFTLGDSVHSSFAE